MRKKLKEKPLWKWFSVYGLIILFGYCALFPAVWGAAVGLLVVGKIAHDPSFQAEVIKKLAEMKTDIKKIPSSERKRLVEPIMRERFKGVNWLAVHLIVNFVTFSVLGVLAGILLKSFLFSGIIPLVMLFSTVPILGSAEFMVKSKTLTISIGVLTQILSVYFFSYAGFWFRKRRSIEDASK